MTSIIQNNKPIFFDPEKVKKFNALAEQWYNETGGSSFIADKINHPAYQKIIALGESIIPLILTELEQHPAYWFEALKTLTGANPIKPEQRGRIKQMTQAWLEWAKNNGYEW